MNVVETGWLELELSTDFGDFAPGVVEKLATAWGQVVEKLCTAGDTGVDNSIAVIHSGPLELSVVREGTRPTGLR
jgi:hypothetical protein